MNTVWKFFFSYHEFSEIRNVNAVNRSFCTFEKNFILSETGF